MVTYTIRKGDTLYKIAKRFNVSAEEIARINNIENPDMISVGLVLRIPVNEGEGSGTPLPGDIAKPASVPSTDTGEEVIDPFRTRVVDNRFLYIIVTDAAQVRQDESLLITLIKVNISNRTLTLNYPTAQRFDFIAISREQEVWRWSTGRAFAQVTGRVTLRPGQLQVFRVVWDLRDNQGNPVPPGPVTICGINVAREIRDKLICIPARILPGVVPTPTPIPPPVGNLLRDPSIEQWVTQNMPEVWSGSNLFRTRLARTGNFAAELGEVHNRSAVLLQRVDNTPGGRRYRLTFWAREDIQPRNIADYVVLAEVLFFDRFGRLVDRSDIRLIPRDIPDNRYQQFVQTSAVINRAATNARVQFIFIPDVDNDNTVKIDDVVLRAL